MRRGRVEGGIGQERDRLWKRWVEVEPSLDGYAARRSTEAPVVVFAPSDAPT